MVHGRSVGRAEQSRDPREDQTPRTRNMQVRSPDRMADVVTIVCGVLNKISVCPTRSRRWPSESCPVKERKPGFEHVLASSMQATL